MSGPSDLESRFARAVEAEYEQRLAAYLAAGAEFEAAHSQALDEAKQCGHDALEELRRRGLFPWSAEEPDDAESGAAVSMAGPAQTRMGRRGHLDAQ